MPDFTQTLLAWYGENARALPWRRDKEPYHVWLSEIMLQQTRAETVRAYYLRALESLPDIRTLAECPRERLMKLWEGLGYYRRAENLQKAAKLVMEQYGGVFPGEYAQIRALPGIGEYTAGAIASICFDQPVPAVDGNVLRIMARLENRKESVDTPAVKRCFTETLRAAYPPSGCGEFTQALMELGACVCTPKAPACERCPVCLFCKACEAGTQRALPVRSEKRPRKAQPRSVFLFHCEGRVALARRGEKGLLAGLWELPGLDGELSETQALEQARAWGLDPSALERVQAHKHVFTHIEWRMRCFVIRCRTAAGDFAWASQAELKSVYALPSAFRPFINTCFSEPCK